jgi:hypothetical protein
MGRVWIGSALGAVPTLETSHDVQDTYIIKIGF